MELAHIQYIAKVLGTDKMSLCSTFILPHRYERPPNNVNNIHVNKSWEPYFYTVLNLTSI